MIRCKLLNGLARSFFVLLILSAPNVLGQADFNFSIEAGTLHDRNHFEYETQSLSGSGFGQYTALGLGINKGNLHFRTGFARYQHSVRIFRLDDASEEVSKIPREAIQEFVESFVVPISVSKEMRLGERWGMEIGLGLLLIVPRDPNVKLTVTSFATRDSSGVEVISPDSTRIVWGTERAFNAGLETFLQFEYKTRSPFSFYASLAFQAHFAPVFEAGYTFFRDGTEFSRGVALGLNSFSFGLGLRYTLIKKTTRKE
jgi:hypothetical protein